MINSKGKLVLAIMITLLMALILIEKIGKNAKHAGVKHPRRTTEDVSKQIKEISIRSNVHSFKIAINGS